MSNAMPPSQKVPGSGVADVPRGGVVDPDPTMEIKFPFWSN